MKSFLLIIFAFISIAFTTQKKDSLIKSTAKIENPKIKDEKIEIQKIELKNQALENYLRELVKKKESKKSIWETLVPLLIGAFLTLGTQIFFDIRKSTKEKNNQIIQSKSELEKLIFLLRHNYNELAMHKAHKHYWYAQFQYEENLEIPDQNDVNKFYNYHIESGNKAINVQNIIAENFSNFTKEISKIQQLTSAKTEIISLYDKYLNFVPQKPKDIMSVDRNELYDLATEDEQNLKKEYEEYINILNEIKSMI